MNRRAHRVLERGMTRQNKKDRIMSITKQNSKLNEINSKQVYPRGALNFCMQKHAARVIKNPFPQRLSRVEPRCTKQGVKEII